jgi:hypothetical protein
LKEEDQLNELLSAGEALKLVGAVIHTCSAPEQAGKLHSAPGYSGSPAALSKTVKGEGSSISHRAKSGSKSGSATVSFSPFPTRPSSDINPLSRLHSRSHSASKRHSRYFRHKRHTTREVTAKDYRDRTVVGRQTTTPEQGAVAILATLRGVISPAKRLLLRMLHTSNHRLHCIAFTFLKNAVGLGPELLQPELPDLLKTASATLDLFTVPSSGSHTTQVDHHNPYSRFYPPSKFASSAVISYTNTARGRRELTVRRTHPQAHSTFTYFSDMMCLHTS